MNFMRYSLKSIAGIRSKKLFAPLMLAALLLISTHSNVSAQIIPPSPTPPSLILNPYCAIVAAGVGGAIIANQAGQWLGKSFIAPIVYEYCLDEEPRAGDTEVVPVYEPGLNELVKRVRPHGCLPSTRTRFLGGSDQCGGDIFGEFVYAGGVA